MFTSDYPLDPPSPSPKKQKTENPSNKEEPKTPPTVAATEKQNVASETNNTSKDDAVASPTVTITSLSQFRKRHRARSGMKLNCLSDDADVLFLIAVSIVEKPCTDESNSKADSETNSNITINDSSMSNTTQATTTTTPEPDSNVNTITSPTQKSIPTPQEIEAIVDSERLKILMNVLIGLTNGFSVEELVALHSKLYSAIHHHHTSVDKTALMQVMMMFFFHLFFTSVSFLYFSLLVVFVFVVVTENCYF
jgi:hypothetical protein